MMMTPKTAVTERSHHNTTTNSNSSSLSRTKVVQVLTRGIWIVSPVAPNVCEVTLINRMEDTGKIPQKITNIVIGRKTKKKRGTETLFMVFFRFN